MTKPPKHAVGPDFDKARDWMDQQEGLLTREQRHDYDKLKERQKKEQKAHQNKVNEYHKALEQKARHSRNIAELVYHPPKKQTSDVNKLLYQTKQAEKNLADLRQKHMQQRITTLESFEKQRERSGQEQEKNQTQEQFKSSWIKTVEKVARQQNYRERAPNMAKDLRKATSPDKNASKDFNKASLAKKTISKEFNKESGANRQSWKNALTKSLNNAAKQHNLKRDFDREK